MRVAWEGESIEGEYNCEQLFSMIINFTRKVFPVNGGSSYNVG